MKFSEGIAAFTADRYIPLRILDERVTEESTMVGSKNRKVSMSEEKKEMINMAGGEKPLQTGAEDTAPVCVRHDGVCCQKVRHDEVQHDEAQHDKVRHHKVLDRTVLSFFLLMTAGIVITNVFDILLDGTISDLLERTGHERYSTGAGAAVGSLLWLLAFRFMFRREGYRGQLGFRGFLKGLAMLSYVIVLSCFMNLQGIIFNGAGDAAIAFLSAVSTAFSEEIVLRGPGLSNMMRKAENEKQLLKAWLIPSVVFGLIHFSNLLAGAAPITTVCQVMYATGIGLMYGAAVLRTGSLWPAVTAHFLTDFTVLLDKNIYESQGVLNTETGIEGFLFFVTISLTFTLAGSFLMRKSKRPEILDLWACKWNREDCRKNQAVPYENNGEKVTGTA